ncbi:ATP-binding cassette domain-containing protein [Nesterenkonia natronophila]|uniref:UvrABC system protein A n=1 Tax=Nesterenkonia natronophila TaxID=2174932 RepID=A0A3A4FBJ6_9MICC|nr:excinuclease ABC subunit UvrA [Nesterenkonia natronophila]RJN32174.1 excinuclease ABC subunit UvrA [Nesterenkonia natronophila]
MSDLEGDVLSVGSTRDSGHEYIRIRGARKNNLRSINVDIPKRQLTVFTGVSGSGKSSLVFGTIAAESRRLINETYDAFIQGFMPSMPRPEVESLEGLTAAIIIDQERMSPNPRSTVGTVTDVNSMLRTLFSRFAEPQIGSPQAYSFNVASASGSGTLTKGDGTQKAAGFSITGGMCLRCQGRGQINAIDITQLVDETKSLSQGAITIPGYKAGGWSVRFYTDSGFFDPDKPVMEYTAQERHDLYYREPGKVKIGGANMTFQGLVPSVKRSFLTKDREGMQPHIRAFVDRAVTFTRCPECTGTRLAQKTLASRIAGNNIAELCAMQISDLASWINELDAGAGHLRGAEPLLTALGDVLRHFTALGLGYLTLERSAGTLSGGEAQRIKMIRHLGSSLTDVTYVFDEPTIGLHPHDVERMNDLLLKLRDKGNTVLVVEHDPDVMAVADRIVDMGPAAGKWGGEIVYNGDFAGLRTSGTATGDHLEARQPIKQRPRPATGMIRIRGATRNNLRNVDIDIPQGVFVAVSGVAGSGKSSLIHGSLAEREGVVVVDQAPIRGSRRSNPATYTGLLDPIRKAFAKANGVRPALFSANSEGACPNCSGAGVVYQDLGIIAGISTVCEECQGKRFQPSVLEYTLGGLNIADVLATPVQQALEFFSGEGTGGAEAALPAAVSVLNRLRDVGLGYLTLGQPLSTLSGGERQRIKLAIEIGSEAEVLILDEPTSGLHLADTERMISMLETIVDLGRSVIVIEHHPDVISRADWVIDIGPGAGHDGGQVIFSGPPEDLLSASRSLTAAHLIRRR